MKYPETLFKLNLALHQLFFMYLFSTSVKINQHYSQLLFLKLLISTQTYIYSIIFRLTAVTISPKYSVSMFHSISLLTVLTVWMLLFFRITVYKILFVLCHVVRL